MRRSAAAVLCRLTKGHERAHSKRPESFLLAAREMLFFLVPLAAQQWAAPLSSVKNFFSSRFELGS
jgi:hypothetical protein